MKKKSILIILSIITVLVLSSLLYISYGFITSKIEGNSSAKKFANLSQVLRLEYSDGSEKLSTALDSYFIPGSKLTKTFTITNKGNVNIDFSINLKNIINDFERENDLVYEIKSDNVILNSGTFPKSNYAILPKETIGIGESKTYTLIIEYLTSTENQIIDNGKFIDAEIVIEEDVKTISKFQILGNSIQDENENGLASPTNPIEIQSLGDKTQNMFDIKDFKETYAPFQPSILQPSFVNLKDEGIAGPEQSEITALKMPANINVDGKAYKYMEGEFKLNTRYTVSFNAYDIPGTNGAMGIFLYLYYTDGTYDNLVRTRKKNEWYTVEFTSDVNKTVSHLQIPTYGTGSAYTYLYDFQIEEGTSKTAYENPGYKINLKATGKNIFPLNDYEGKISWSNGTDKFPIVKVPVKQNSDYTFSYSSAERNSATVRLFVYNNSTLNENGRITTYILPSDNGGTYTFNSSSNSYLYFTIRNNAGAISDLKISDMMLEEGTTATEYEPYSIENYNIYLEQPLRKSGACETCNDYIDLIDKKFYKNVYAGNIPLDKLINYSHLTTPERYSLTLGYHTTSSIIPNHEKLPINIANYVGQKYTMDITNKFIIKYDQLSYLHWILAPTYAYLIAPTGYTISSFFTENASLYPNGWSFQYALANSKISDIETPNLLKIGQDKIHFSACDSKGICASDIIVEYTK